MTLTIPQRVAEKKVFYQITKKGSLLKNNLISWERPLGCRDRHKKLVEARSVFCFFTVTELGVRLTDLAPRFSMTGPAIGFAVRRGRDIAERKRLRLV